MLYLNIENFVTVRRLIMNSSPGKSIDYVTPQKKQGKYLVIQILLYVLYAAAFLGVFVFFASQFGVLGIVIGGLLGPTLVFILYLATRHICTFDRKCMIYTPKAKKMDDVPLVSVCFEIIKDKKGDPDKRNIKFEGVMRDGLLFAPYKDEYKDKYAAADVKKTIDFRGDVKNPDVYFCVFPGEGGKTVVIFETVSKFVEMLQYYNKEATVVEEGFLSK